VVLDPALLEAIAARVRYFRDLGVFDLYRRGQPLDIGQANAAPEAELALSSMVTTTVTIDEIPALFENPSRMARSLPSISRPAPSPWIAPKDRADALERIREEIGDCQRCPLAPSRNKLVFGDGNPNARLLFVGEGPGADEDAQGLPFVGRGGQLLNNMITAMGLKREAVYIANIVKCRPPKNRVPEPIEANTCKPFLFQQIEVIQPELIVALGATAATYLLGAKASLSSLRGRLHHAFNTKVIVTYHPAFLLRDPTQKKEAWKDLQMAMVELGLKPKRAES